MSSSLPFSTPPSSTEHKEKTKDAPESKTIVPPLSRRGQRTIPSLLPLLGHIEPPIYLPGYERAPSATDINLSTAENWLLRPRMVPKFLEYLNRDFDSADLSYVSGFGGAPDLLSGLATFFNTYFNPRIEVIPGHLVTAPGASHLLQSVMYDLCNEGEAVMIQTPYWPGFDSALVLRDALTAVHVNVPFAGDNADPYGPDIVREYYARVFQESPENITAMIICNPQNPLGGVYPVETLKELLRFAGSNTLHIVVDELYALSEFRPDLDPAKRFCSVLSIDLDELGVDPGLVHVVYSMSKDLGSSGIRLGVLVTQNNDNLRQTVGVQQQSKLSSLTSVAASGLLQETEFLNEILEDNPNLLLENYNIIEDFLKYHNVPYIPGTAGLFIFANLLSVTGKPMNFDEEEALDKLFTEKLVRVNRGFNFHSTEPGWFRLIFAVPKDVLIAGLIRVQEVLGGQGWNPPGVKF